MTGEMTGRPDSTPTQPRERRGKNRLRDDVGSVVVGGIIEALLLTTVVIWEPTVKERFFPRSSTTVQTTPSNDLLKVNESNPKADLHPIDMPDWAKNPRVETVHSNGSFSLVLGPNQVAGVFGKDLIRPGDDPMAFKPAGNTEILFVNTNKTKAIKVDIHTWDNTNIIKRYGQLPKQDREKEGEPQLEMDLTSIAVHEADSLMNQGYFDAENPTQVSFFKTFTSKTVDPWGIKWYLTRDNKRSGAPMYFMSLKPLTSPVSINVVH